MTRLLDVAGVSDACSERTSFAIADLLSATSFLSASSLGKSGCMVGCSSADFTGSTGEEIISSGDEIPMPFATSTSEVFAE